MTEHTHKTPVYRKDYTVSDFLIDTVLLECALHPEATKVSSTMQIKRNPASLNAQAPLVLNGESLILSAVYLNQELLAADCYTLTRETLTIPHLPDTCALRIETICNPEANTALNGLYLSRGTFCTQCEAHGFRRITYYLDRPDVLATFTTTIIADPKKCPVMLSNGNCIADELLANGQRKVIWQDPIKKPCYLFALVAGNLDYLEDAFVTRSQRAVVLRIYVEPGNKDKALHAMAMLKEAMRWDEEHYGREYDLDIFMIVAVPDFNMGAMENKGLNIFNAKYILADSDTATDADYEGIATVVAHEYFHNWTGNRITCRDWFQLSLKEGLTVFRDQQFTADLLSPVVTRIDDVRGLRTAQFTEDAGPLAHPVRPDDYLEMNNFYTATVYNKGAEVIRMLHTLEGVAGYRKGMDLYFERFDGMAVTCDDFVQAHADANQRDYRKFMGWYARSGTPKLTFTDCYDAVHKKYELTVVQASQEPFHLPINVALFNPETGVLLRTEILELTEVTQHFEFLNMAVAPVPSLMRGFSAPVRWTYPYTLTQKIFLLQHDDDLFNRFEMNQQIVNQFFLDATTLLPDAYLTALHHILNDEMIDPAVKSRLLSVPSYRELCDVQTKIAVEYTINQRKNIVQQVSDYLAALAAQWFVQLQKKNATYIFNADAVGIRSLLVHCLGILLEARDKEALEWCQSLYDSAHNMTDRFNTLLLLMLYADETTRTTALHKFYERFKHNDLVVEKWFTLQAMVPEASTLHHVQALMKHPAFDFKNPNKVRALIGAFTQQNFEGFHLPDGSAYEFLAEQVLALDQINPQIAARLVEPLTRWQAYEDAHAVLMRSALQRIALTPQLSADLYEIVHKSCHLAA